jgi:hypothetical protein
MSAGTAPTGGAATLTATAATGAPLRWGRT